MDWLKEILTKAGVEFTKVDAEENLELTQKYGIKTAPTLLITKDGETKQFVNLSNIKGGIEKHFEF